MKVVYVSSKEMASVDKIAINSGLEIKQMMENAGRNLSDFVSKLNPKRVFVFYGKGNNGGGGLVCARHLSIKGVNVSLISASKKNELNNIVRDQNKLLKNVKEYKDLPSFKKGDLIVDALLGYNLRGTPKGKYFELIEKINLSKNKGVKIVSLDLPSGTNPDTGKSEGISVDSNYILTLALPKKGLRKFKNVYLVNIGIPNYVYKKLGIEVGNYFSKSNVVKVSKTKS